jgi:tight adherence protein C
MLLILTLLVFALVASASLALGLWRGSTGYRGVQRLAPIRVVKAAPARSRWAAWRELAARAGSVMPSPSKDVALLQRRLVRAGIRAPNAVRIFQGVRGAVALGLGVAGLAGSLHARAAHPFLAAAGMAALGYVGASHYLKLRIGRRKRAIQKGLPNALDLLVVCVESGLGMDQAILQVSKELHDAHPEICEEFALMNLELRAGKSRQEALHNLAGRTGVEDVKKLVAVLVQTDRFGTSIAQSLRGHADYLRVMSRQRAEEKAAKLAVKLVFPIFFCVLPSLFIVTIGPVITRLIRDLIPMIENM